MKKLELTIGLMEILRNIVRSELQRILAQDLVGGETMNYDKAAWLLTIYDSLNDTLK